MKSLSVFLYRLFSVGTSTSFSFSLFCRYLFLTYLLNSFCRYLFFNILSNPFCRYLFLLKFPFCRYLSSIKVGYSTILFAFYCIFISFIQFYSLFTACFFCQNYFICFLLRYFSDVTTFVRFFTVSFFSLIKF